MSEIQNKIEKLKTLQESYDVLTDVVENLLPALADKIDNIKLPEIDTTELAKQGENPDATLTAIYKLLIGGNDDEGVEAAYEWLENRVKGRDDGTIPAIPLATPLTGEKLAENLSVLDSRKISSGNEDGILDGVSLVRLLCDDTLPKIIKIVDDNVGWVMNRVDSLNALVNLLGNGIIDISCSSITKNVWSSKTDAEVEIHFSKCTYLNAAPLFYIRSETASARPNTSIYFDVLEDLTNWRTVYESPYILANKVYLPALKRGTYHNGGASAHYNRTTTYIYIGCMGGSNDLITISNAEYIGYQNTTVKDIEIRNGSRQPISIININGLTAENIALHILDRLADNTDGETITIRIGETNLATIEGDANYSQYLDIARNKNYTIA